MNFKIIQGTKKVLPIMERLEGLDHTLDFGFNSFAITKFITVTLQTPF